MNQVQVFNNLEFGEIRTVIIGNQPWFVAMDIAENLGYAQTANMLKQVDVEDKEKFAPSKTDDAFSNMTRQATIINESGLYSAIMGSKLPNAKKFKRWVTSEVLPQIRKTGSYDRNQLPQTTDGKIALLAQGHVELKEEINSVREDLEALKMDLPVLPIEADKITIAAKKRGVDVMGGKSSPAYNDRGTRQRVYNSIYANLKYNFGVRSYKSIKRCQVDKAIEIINQYQPPFFLKEQINGLNAQQTLKF